MLEQNPGILKDRAIQKVANMVGIGKSSMYTIIAAYSRNQQLGLKSSSLKKKKQNNFEIMDKLIKQ